MELKSNEFELNGSWILENGKVIEDEISKKINHLINNILIKIAVSESGWEVLYQDPEDKKYWELTYKNSDLQGAGPKSLINITQIIANKKYNL